MIRWGKHIAGFAGLLIALTGCVSSPRFAISGKEPGADGGTGTASHAMVEEGIASYYADEYNGRKTSNGEVYDMYKMTAAHRTLPFNSVVRVTNVTNGKTVNVRINDRGPFKDDRIIDLSLSAAREIGMIGPGTAPVRLDVVEFGDTTKQK